MIGGDRAAARPEIADVLVVADAQAAEIDAVTRNRRRVELNAELQEAIELLSAAEIEVTVTDDLDDLEPGASSLLGWALREAPPTSCATLVPVDARSCCGAATGRSTSSCETTVLAARAATVPAWPA